MPSIPFGVPEDRKIKQGQKASLATDPAMKSYLEEKAATDANTAKLRALRLAKEAADGPVAVKKKTAAARKPGMKRGIGSA